jgi:glycopeptide antibiotics resistance protein
MINQFLHPAFIIFGVTLPLWIVYRLIANAYNKKHHKPFSFKQELVLFVFYVYITSVLIITVVPVAMSRKVDSTVDRTNLTPVINSAKHFEKAQAANNSIETKHLLENTVGNLVLFIPLGILLPLVAKKIDSAKKIILVSFIFSACIELTQFIWRYFGIYRTADIDDIILNTAGGFLGFVLVYWWVLRKRRNPVN